jgi:hypothetical protein
VRNTEDRDDEYDLIRNEMLIDENDSNDDDHPEQDIGTGTGGISARSRPSNTFRSY